MHINTYLKMNDSFMDKLEDFKENPFLYLMSSVLAGIFIALGSCVAMTIGTLFKDTFIPDKLMTSISFTVALSLIVMIGGDLFTGSNLSCGLFLFGHDYYLKKKLKYVIPFSIMCWFGNLIGSWIIVLLFHYSGLTNNNGILEYFVNTGLNKVSIPILEMVIRGILCNIFVCLAVWCCKCMSSESGKLIMVFWCVFSFMICSFEHCVANMSIIGIGVLVGNIHIMDYILNLTFVTIGNVIGGVFFVALPIYLIRLNR